MNLFIIRHAHAVEADDDPKRPLSNRGRKQVGKLAAFLKPSGALATREVWHSPLARSLETAELLIKKLELQAKLAEVEGLEGDDDPAAIATELKIRSQPLAIVGHDPQLSALTSLLVTGAAEPPRFLLKKCAAVALERIEGIWVVRWHVSPEILA